MNIINESIQMAEMVCGKVRGLPLPSFKKKTLLEDCEKALEALRAGDFAIALLSINVLADKVDTLREKGNFCSSKPLFHDIHQLQQLILKLPLKQEGPTGPPGPPGPQGSPGPPGPSYPSPCPPKFRKIGEMVQNPGFECFLPCAPNPGEAIRFDFWDGEGEIGITSNLEDVHTLCVAAVLGDFGKLKQVIDLSPGISCNFLHFSFFAKAKGLSGSLMASLIFLDRKQRPIHPIPIEVVINHVPSYQYEYYRFVMEDAIPEDAFSIEILFKNLQTGRRIFLDDISLSA